MTTTKPLSKKAEKAAERQEAIQTLRKWLKPGATVHTILRHVSASGMQRRISLVISIDNEPTRIDWYAARAMDMRLHNDGGIVIGGCGMDMGFALVYDLSRTLFPEGFKVTDKTTHRNGTPNGRTDNDGGYALSHRWL